MGIRENIYKVVNLIKPSHVLVSVFDKNGLAYLTRSLVEINSSVMFYSTGGTAKKIREVLGDNTNRNFTSVEKFTGAPEMEGGLVKTLHPKIHAGLLAERGNPAHEDYLYKTLADMTRSPGVYFDVFVGNLYPFTSVIADQSTTPETARVNIDIGGPAMTMASAKNWHSVAVLSSPSQYEGFVNAVRNNEGQIDLKTRFDLAKEAMAIVGEYRLAIGRYFSEMDYDLHIRSMLNIEGKS